ncbi:MAG: malate permease [Candidatus Sumerlaeota bacterium]|nr:malate permease [Candidatus Sumerlaeota bacterium]
MDSFLPPGFADAFGPVLATMATLFLVSFAGFLAVRLKIIDDKGVTALTRLLIDVIVPCRMAVSMMAGLNSETLAQCGFIIVLMATWTFVSLGLSSLATRVWRGGDPARNRAIWALSSFQNGIYVPLPLVLALVPAEEQDLATVYVGGAVIVMILCQWSIGVTLLRGREKGGRLSVRETLRGMVNPPLMAILGGALLAFVPPFALAARTGEGPAVLTIPMSAAETVGSTLGPIAMIVLGMMIGGCRLSGALSVRTLGIPILIRLLLSPAVMLVFLMVGPLEGISSLVALVLIVEAAAPPATNLSIIARRYGGDWEMIASALLVTYLLALLTLPFFAAMILSK